MKFKKWYESIVLIIVFAFIFSGCVVMDVADVFIEDTPVHFAEVQSITKSKEKTILFFVDGYNYEISNHIYVKPGYKVKIFKNDDGSYSAEVDKKRLK